MTSSVFPDLNVWIALTLVEHQHHRIAWKWYRSLPETTDLVFCRFTQMGFLRLLTLRAVTGDQVLSQRQAWAAYDRWIEESDCVFAEEPYGLESNFRQLADLTEPSPKAWADSYLAAFAKSKSIDLVTFDRALHQRVRGSILLAAEIP